MKTLGITALLAAAFAATPLSAQEHEQHQPAADQADHHSGPPPYIAAIASDLEAVEQKLVALAEATPDDRWNWRPGEGVRSIGEVFMHVAADNYLLPAMVGVAAPAETGILGDDYNTAVAYETRAMSKAQTIDALRTSFDHLFEVLEGVSHDDLHAEYDFFGNQMSGIRIWILTATHLHEHLGQSIAYARTNGIVPPWSQEN